MPKKCFYCGSKNVVHNGFRDGKQRYKCKECGRRFTGGIRRDKSQVITDYVDGKQTIIQLAVKYKVSERTIRRDLESMRFVRKKAKYKEVTVPPIGAASSANYKVVLPFEIRQKPYI